MPFEGVGNKGFDPVALMLQLRQQRMSEEASKRKSMIDMQKFAFTETRAQQKHDLEMAKAAADLRVKQESENAEIGKALNAANDTKASNEDRYAASRYAVNQIERAAVTRAGRRGITDELMVDIGEGAAGQASLGRAQTRIEQREQETKLAMEQAAQQGSIIAKAQLKSEGSVTVGKNLRSKIRLLQKEPKTPENVELMEALKAELKLHETGKQTIINNNQPPQLPANGENNLISRYQAADSGMAIVAELEADHREGRMVSGSKGFAENIHQRFKGITQDWMVEDYSRMDDDARELIEKARGSSPRSKVDMGKQLSGTLSTIGLAYAYVRTFNETGRITVNELQKVIGQLGLTNILGNKAEFMGALERVGMALARERRAIALRMNHFSIDPDKFKVTELDPQDQELLDRLRKASRGDQPVGGDTPQGGPQGAPVVDEAMLDSLLDAEGI